MPVNIVGPPSWVRQGEAHVDVVAARDRIEDGDVVDVEVQASAMVLDAEVADGGAAGPEQHRGDVGDDLVDEPGAQERGGQGRAALEEHVLAVAGEQLVSAACGSRVRRCTVSAASSSTRRPGGEVALPHHHPQRLVGQRSVVLVADGELRVVDLDRAGADDHRVAQRAQAVGVDPRGRRGDPAAGAVGGGAAPVEGGGELPGDEGAAVLHANVQARLSARAPRRAGRPRPRSPRRAAWPLPRSRPGWGRAGRTPRGDAGVDRARAHGPVRPVWLHGSRVTTAVAPRASAPASASASTSACGVPAPRW